MLYYFKYPFSFVENGMWTGVIWFSFCSHVRQYRIVLSIWIPGLYYFCVFLCFFFFFVRLPDLEKLLSYISSLIRNLGSGYTFENGFTVQNAYTLFYYRKECGTVSQKSKSLRREKMILTIFFSHNLPWHIELSFSNAGERHANLCSRKFLCYFWLPQNLTLISYCSPEDLSITWTVD